MVNYVGVYEQAGKWHLWVKGINTTSGELVNKKNWDDEKVVEVVLPNILFKQLLMEMIVEGVNFDKGKDREGSW